MRYSTKKYFVLSFLLIFVLSFYYAYAEKKDFGKNWYIASSKTIKFDGEKISSPNFKFNKKNWYSTLVPSTVLSTLIKNGLYKNLYFNGNLDKVDRKIFSVPWWYRKEFILNNIKGKNFGIIFNGINYKAELFINGKKIEDKKNFYGAFKRFEFDLTPYIKSGKNIIALKVYPPKKGDYTIGFVDWNPKPPDNNMGIWRTVELKETGDVLIDNLFVKPILDIENRTAKIHIYGEIKNNTDKTIFPKIGCLVKDIGKKTIKKIKLNPNEKKQLELGTMYFNNPKLWWPNNLGEPYLYKLNVSVFIKNNLSDKTDLKFGIRKIEDYMTKEGFRGYKINGKKILIKGGGWVDDLTLTYDKKKIKTQIRYIKDMNLNTIRMEGFWGNSQYIYELADKNGLLIMVGFSCHWEWEDYLGVPVDENFNGPKTKEGIKLLTDYLKNQILWLRNHPSIFVWAVGSDKIPYTELEKRYAKIINKYDGTRPYIASAKEFVSKVSGPTGIKMRGPYAFTAPVYWYQDKEYGGAFGFNSETGPGAQIPVLESIKKMIPKDKLWPINSEWDYHCARNEFKDLSRFVKGLEKRYGKPMNLEEFIKKAQMLNYELIRPMFEAFSVNRYKSTGIIQWMLNSAWPEMYWQLYDWYLVPTAAYYGTKEAAKPLHIIYRYGFKDIWVVNEKFEKQENLSAKIRIFDENSNIVFNKKIGFGIKENSAKPLNINLAKFIRNNRFSFISLKLYKGGKEIDDNFYWVSKSEDILNYEKSDWFITPIEKYADFTAINTLPKTKISVSYKIKEIDNKKIANLIISNKSDKIAFFIDVKVLNDKGEYIIPSTLSDNYFSILPNENKKIFLEIKDDMNLNLKIEGWNTNQVFLNFKDMKQER